MLNTCSTSVDFVDNKCSHDPMKHEARSSQSDTRSSQSVTAEVSTEPHLPSFTAKRQPHNVAPLPAREDLLAYRDLLDRTIADFEQIRECEAKIERLRLAMDDARRRVANRRDEIERRRVALMPERQAA